MTSSRRASLLQSCGVWPCCFQCGIAHLRNSFPVHESSLAMKPKARFEVSITASGSRAHPKRSKRILSEKKTPRRADEISCFGGHQDRQSGFVWGQGAINLARGFTLPERAFVRRKVWRDEATKVILRCRDRTYSPAYPFSPFSFDAPDVTLLAACVGGVIALWTFGSCMSALVHDLAPVLF